MSAITAIAATELAALRARLATAEAVIAALPMCDSCVTPATRGDATYGYFGEALLRYACDAHGNGRVEKLPYAAPLRAYLALAKDGK